MGLVSWDRKGPLRERAGEIGGGGRLSTLCPLPPSDVASGPNIQGQSIGDSGAGAAETGKL